MTSYTIQFLGGPASGKSTAALGLCTELKCMGLETELSLEYIKPLVYNGIKITPFTQYAIFGHEIEQMERLFNKVPYIISDSSPLLACFYQWYYNKNNTLRDACQDFYKTAEARGIKFINFFLPHRDDYNCNGRIQSKEEAIEVEKALKAYLNAENYPYTYLDCDDTDRIGNIIIQLRELTNNFEGMRDEG